MAVGAFDLIIFILRDLRNYEMPHALIEAGKQLEGELRTPGQFEERPREVVGLMNEPFAARVIYPGVLAAWTFLALVFTRPEAAWLLAILVFIVGFAGTLIYSILLRKGLIGQAHANNQKTRGGSALSTISPRRMERKRD
jgi:hypothetical protein